MTHDAQSLINGHPASGPSLPCRYGAGAPSGVRSGTSDGMGKIRWERCVPRLTSSAPVLPLIFSGENNYIPSGPLIFGCLLAPDVSWYPSTLIWPLLGSHWRTVLSYGRAYPIKLNGRPFNIISVPCHCGIVVNYFSVQAVASRLRLAYPLQVLLPTICLCFLPRCWPGSSFTHQLPAVLSGLLGPLSLGPSRPGSCHRRTFKPCGSTTLSNRCSNRSCR